MGQFLPCAGTSGSLLPQPADRDTSPPEVGSTGGLAGDDRIQARAVPAHQNMMRRLIAETHRQTLQQIR